MAPLFIWVFSGGVGMRRVSMATRDELARKKIF
jgi:hypothetical protein